MKVEQKKFLRNVLIILVAVAVAYWLNVPQMQEEPLPTKDEALQQTAPKSNNKNLSGDYVLALTWQPAFCEQKPNKTECRSQRSGRFDVTNFSLHGLWPQPRSNVYCDPNFTRSGNWRDLPRLQLSKSTRNELDKKMPGSRSYLHRHEWYKHGTCASGISPEQYFRVSFSLLDEVNASALRSFFADNIGKKVRLSEAARQMDKTFGNGAGDRLTFRCNRDGKRVLITEIRINLTASNSEDLSPIALHMEKAEKANSQCKSGVIDPVGLQ